MRVRVGSNVAIVVVFSGVAFLESVRSRTWL